MRVGVDLGGTKIEAVVLDESGVERARRRVPTPPGDYDGIVAAVVGLVEAVESDVDGRWPVGIGTPGVISPATGLMKNANSVVLNGHALDRDLADALGRDVRLANDADCFALSEAVDGAGAGFENVFGVILGTGVGGGIVVGGRLVAGPNGIAGEWGHNQLPYLGAADEPVPECYCGRIGCVETFLSGPSLERDHLTRSGQHLPAREIAARAASDAEAGEALDRYADRLARALSTVINVVDPDIVVLGGGVSNVEMLYARVPELWGRYVFSDTVETTLARNVHGDSGGVRGAAWLWPESA